MVVAMKEYITTYGRVIPGYVLAAVKRDVLAGEDYQRTITNELREIIPVHAEDLEEAAEIYSHVEEQVDMEMDWMGGEEVSA